MAKQRPKSITHINEQKTNTKELTNFERAQVLLHLLDENLKRKASEEQQSEQRLRFFLTITTAIGGMFAILYQKDCSFFENHSYVTLLLLAIVFSYGLLTFSRIIWRNHEMVQLDSVISFQHKAIDNLDEGFRELQQLYKWDRRKRCYLIQHLNGSFTQFLYVTEGLLAGAFVYVLSLTLGFWPWLVWTLTCIIPIFVVLSLCLWANDVRNLSEKTDPLKFIILRLLSCSLLPLGFKR